jgi:TolB-like protein/tetratricopeptide (TPR) repeat protein
VIVRETHQREVAAGPTSVRPGQLSALLRELVRSPEGEPGSAWIQALRPGAVVGRFELVRELGRGGFGVVYEARDRELRRSVAFKAVRAGGHPEVREERLLREAEAAARLSHPNIVTLYDVERSEHGPYLVMELLEGETLAQRLEQGPVTLREAVRIGVEVAKGLAHAHAQGVFHRDLTPANVYLCRNGQVKVLDLGMAHAFGHRRVEGGTPRYMAPEQERGAPEDERTDVFALGVILHRMIADELPSRGRVGGVARGSPAVPGLEVPEEPALGALVSRMLRADPIERPRDAGEVLAALTAFQQELERTPLGTAPARARGRRRRGWTLAALAAAGVALGAGVTRLVTRSPAGVEGAGRAPSDPAAPSIAVLPFADMSPHRDQEYFSDGIAEEILNALAHVEGLHVAGRTSSFAFKGKSEDLRDIGRQLHVGAVLEGSVREAGGRVRVTAKLVDAGDGYDLWSETFDRSLADVFAVQDEIARAVVEALRVQLLPGKMPSTKAYQTAHPEAHNQYLLARQFYGRASDDGFRRAVEAYRRALEIDPRYAPAWAGLAIQLVLLAEHAETPAAAKGMRQRALAAAEEAVAHAPGLAEGYTARGLLRAQLEWDWAGAQSDLQRARELAPGDADVLRRHAILLGILGKPTEALAATRQAIEIDPLFASNWLSLGLYDMATGQLGLARSALQRALEIAPENEHAKALLGMISLLEGQPAEALARFEPLEGMDHLYGVALAQHDLGHARESQQALERFIARYGDLDPTYVVGIYAWEGQRDKALEWLNRAYERHDPHAGQIRQWEFMTKLAEDPRYRALLAKMRLPLD